jgi:cytochrome c peroxidase
MWQTWISPRVSNELKAEFRRPTRIPFPSENPFSEAKYQLGLRLFFDARLSLHGDLSCASCHRPSQSWSDGLPRAQGSGHRPLARRTPTLLNAAWGTIFFWDGRADSLEAQALGPIQAKDEMGLPLPELVRRLEAVPAYRRYFENAFPGKRIASDTIAKAIATFERTLVSEVAPFDRWVEGEESAISSEAKRGFALFNQVGCVNCHTGWSFTNDVFADTGLETPDLGRGKILGNSNLNHAFKAPTLRNVALRGPYFHDGSAKSLEAVIEHYDRGGEVPRPTAKLFLKPLHLTNRQKADLLAFLRSLSSEDEVVSAPSLPDEREGDIWRGLSSTR